MNEAISLCFLVTRKRPRTEISLVIAAVSIPARCPCASSRSPKALGRALALGGSGAGLTFRATGGTFGTETQQLITANLPAYTPSGSIAASGLTSSTNVQVNSAGNMSINNPGGTTPFPIQNNSAVGVNVTATFTGTPQGGASTAFSIMQPTTFLNAMIKY